MSTMYDALRKAEAERNKTTVTTTKTGPSVKGMLEIVKIVALVIAVVVVFTIAYNRFKRLYAGNHETGDGHANISQHC